jgi:hypothetical protein
MSTVIISTHDFDFERFGRPAVDVALFGVLFPAYGLLVVPLFEALERLIPASEALPTRRFRPRTILIVAVLTAAAIFATLMIVLIAMDFQYNIETAVEHPFLSAPIELEGGIFFYLVILVPAACALLRRRRADGEASGWATNVPNILLALPVLLGSALTAWTIDSLLTGGK